MINFIDNIGEYFASNYFDDDFTKKAIDKSGYSADAMKLKDRKSNLAIRPKSTIARSGKISLPFPKM